MVKPDLVVATVLVAELPWRASQIGSCSSDTRKSGTRLLGQSRFCLCFHRPLVMILTPVITRYYDYALMGGWVYEPHIVARAEAASPVTRASHLRAPLLVLHGDKDSDVPYRQILIFVEAAKRSTHAGSSVEFVSYAGEGHGLSGTKAQKDVLDQLERFLRVHLKPWDFTSNPHGDVAAY